MPRSSQIMPQYPYPHEEVIINDYSEQDISTTATSETTYPYICVFAGPKGVDNKLVKVTSLPNYETMFGKTNYKKYGQPHLMPVAILSQPGAVVWAMRVLPDDALYANAIPSLWYKADKENKKFYIKFTQRHMGLDYDPELGEDDMKTILSSRDSIIEMANQTDGVPVDGVYVDEEGFIQVPLGVITAPGRGQYGQNLRWRITSNPNYENLYGMKIYTFEILDVESGAVAYKPFNAMICSTAKLKQTLFINDLVEDTDIEKLGAHIHLFEENIEELYDVYKSFCEEILEEDPTLGINIPTLETFDPFFGMECKNERVRITPAQPFIEFVTPLTDDIDTSDENFDESKFTNTDVIMVDDVAGNILLNGSDGSFADPDANVRKDAMSAMYIKAFNGSVDRSILAPGRRYSVSLFDANYDMPGKMALARLALRRSDALLYLDTGLQEILGGVDVMNLEQSFAELDEMVKEYENFEDNIICSVNTHYEMVKEESTGKRVPVTITYYLAATDVAVKQGNLVRTDGNAVLSGHVKDSLRPIIEETDAELKTALYNARINYFEAVGDNEFWRSTQSCYVHTKSDLLEEDNVVNLLNWKRILTAEARANRQRHTTAKSRADFKRYIEDKYEHLVGENGWFASMEVQYTSNELEQKMSVVHLYSAISFHPTGKTTIIEIDVNSKKYDPDVTDDE